MCLSRRARRWPLVAVLWAVAVPLGAQAADWRAEVEVPFGGSDARWFTAPTLRGHYGLSQRWRLRTEWGFVGSIQQSQGGNGWSQFESGNLLLAFNARGPKGGFSWSAGAGLAAPLAELGSEPDRRGRIAFGDASTLQGLWDLWLWAPDRLGVVAPATVGLKSSWYRVELEGAAGLLVPVRQTIGSGLDGLGQLRLAASLLARETAEVGAQLQGVVLATRPGDQGQVSVAGFARLQVGKVTVGTRVLIPIDAPLTSRWSLHLSVSVRGSDGD
ncbi:MAG TPA: hypothetical protein VGK67_34540 [Myxococcales bacterium]|jgi:hypothetical protein